jgi:hypothetical protein
VKIRSTGELQAALDEELSWRRMELINMKFAVRDADGNRQTVLARAGHALAYAHWEGFVKQGLEYYLTLVRTQAPPLERLADAFAGLALTRHVEKKQGLGDHARVAEVCRMLREEAGAGAHLPSNALVDTKGNLKSELFRQLFETLGMDPSGFSTRFNYIDSNLLNARNSIAHGRATFPSLDEFLETVDVVIELLEHVHTAILNAAVQKQFLRGV